MWSNCEMKERNSSITKKIAGAAIVLSGAYFLMKAIAKKKSEGREIDADNPYIDKTELPFSSVTIYEQTFKPIIDKSLAFAGLVILSPLFAAISAAIFIDDPGTIFFTQKRIGKDKRFFCLHKFRSMKMSTPHDVPTHQLRDPEQYITRVGRVLRKTSLDELPQIWD
ncbi:MAG: sugar transferase, partial [Lachnospiraceae bacterium]|nr:sugar transferase [Lachnospiraceae bacterium]